ncbi:MAG TPA: TetR/AcrR family transcriptional regulator [Mycobacteriales bacterium]|nr:TetR/AcrR family transcriptional regulator [Mycobacteriales bacterium]
MPRRNPDRRRALLEAADRAILRDGPDTSMSVIAAEAGVTKPILYRHFGDKGGLYRALAERHTDEVLAEIRDALGAPGDLRRRVTAAVDRYLALIEARPTLYRFLLQRATVEDPGVASDLGLFVRRLGDELGSAIVAERRLRGSAAVRGRTWGHAMVGMVQAAGDWWLEERPCGRRVLVGNVVDLLFGAFPPGPGPAGRGASPRAG